MDEGTGNARLSVSEERIQRLFADFETRLVTRLQQYATNESVRALEKVIETVKDRVHGLELAEAKRNGEDVTSTRYSARAIAWATLFAAVLGSVVTIVLLRHA